MIPSTSSFPLLAFLAMAVLLVLFKAWRGWRLGVVRQVAGVAALVAAWVCGTFGGKLVAPLLHAVWPGPDRILSAVGGLLLAIVVFVVLTLASAILFKKTEHQSVGLIRFGYGIAGAIVGAGYGLALVWLAILAVRVLGTIAEAQLALEKNPNFRTKTTRDAQSPLPVVPALAQLKRSLEDGALGALVEHLDPMPASVYSTLSKLGRVVSEPVCIERFTRYPGVKPLLDHPRIAELFSDPQIQRAARERNYAALFSNPRILTAANDPDLAAALGRLDLEKALNFALKPSEPPGPHGGR